MRRISWDDALDEIAARFDQAEREFGAESVWPYYYAGTMGLVMRDGINRLAHVKKYSRFYSTICVDHRAGRIRRRHRQGRGRRSARDGRLRPGRDLGHQSGEYPGQCDDACRPGPQGTRREDRGGRCLQQRHHEAGRYQDHPAARHRRRFACGVMHVLFREGYADRDYLARYTDCPARA